MLGGQLCNESIKLIISTWSAQFSVSQMCGNFHSGCLVSWTCWTVRRNASRISCVWCIIDLIYVQRRCLLLINFVMLVNSRFYIETILRTYYYQRATLHNCLRENCIPSISANANREEAKIFSSTQMKFKILQKNIRNAFYWTNRITKPLDTSIFWFNSCTFNLNKHILNLPPPAEAGSTIPIKSSLLFIFGKPHHAHHILIHLFVY